MSPHRWEDQYFIIRLYCSPNWQISRERTSNLRVEQKKWSKSEPAGLHVMDVLIKIRKKSTYVVITKLLYVHHSYYYVVVAYGLRRWKKIGLKPSLYYLCGPSSVCSPVSLVVKGGIWHLTPPVHDSQTQKKIQERGADSTQYSRRALYV